MGHGTLENQFPFVGDGMLRIGWIGEWAAPVPPTSSRWSRPTRRWTRVRDHRPAPGVAACRLRHRGPARPAEGAGRGDLDLRLPLAEQPVPHGAPVGPLFPQLVASGVDLGLREDGLHIGPTTPSSSSTSRRRDSPGPASRSTRGSRSAASRRCTSTHAATPGTSTARTTSARSSPASVPTCSCSIGTTSLSATGRCAVPCAALTVVDERR